MRILLSLFLFAFCPMVLGAQQIHGSLSDANAAGQYMKLSEIIGKQVNVLDSTLINNSLYFNFPTKKYEVGMYRLSLQKDNFVDVIVNSKEDDQVLVHFNSNYLNSSISVINSDENRMLFEYLGMKQGIDREADQLRQKIKNTLNGAERSGYRADLKALEGKLFDKLNAYAAVKPKSFFLAMKRADVLPSYSAYQAEQATKGGKNYKDEFAFMKDHFFDNVDFDDERLVRSTVFTDKMHHYLKNYTENSEDGIIASLNKIMDLSHNNDITHEHCLNYLLNQFDTYGPKLFFQYLVENFLLEEGCGDVDVDEVYRRKAEGYDKLRPGKFAPTMSIPDLNGDLFDVASLVAKNEATVLVFWSSGCQHCKSEIPHLKELLGQYKAKGLAYLAISMDNKKENWEWGMNSFGLVDWMHLSELKGWSAQAADTYKVHKTPILYLLDKDMKIIAKPKNSKVLETDLQTYFK